ncbi:MAG: MOSC domain-containing protein [Pseudomonadota bacterium]
MGLEVKTIYRYPVKGLSPQRLDSTAVEAGKTLPFDRMYAIENGPGRFDPLAPKHLPKINFLMLMRNEALASLETDFEPKTHTLTINRGGKQVARGQLSAPIGRQLVEQFFAAFLTEGLRGAPKVVFSADHSFSDVKNKCLHIVSEASLDDLARVVGQPIDARRFRPNVVMDGVQPWEEFGWVDRSIRIGTAKLRVIDRTMRCAATEVDPDTGRRDLSIPAILERTFGHNDFGIYAEVIEDGEIQTGSDIELLS